MKDKLVRLDVATHKMLKSQAAALGMTIKAYLTKLAYENIKD